MMRLELPVLDDILFLSEAPLGTVALVDRDDIVRAQGRVRFQMRSPFFHHCFTFDAMLADHFQSPLKSHFAGSTAEPAQAHKLSVLRLRALTVSQQQVTAEFLDTEGGRMDGHGSTTRTVIGRLEKYRQCLVPCAITGNIHVRELV